MRKPYPSETKDRFMVRLPDGMRDRIDAAAKDSGRTMNAEIVARLEVSFGSGETVEVQLKRLTKRVAAIERRLDGGLPSLEIEDDDA